ncbi:MAG: universal stress protein [Candidatus Methanoperedens nitroreducens]|uniref:Universal stress protein n=1 Tax=Candidatus Methanoperedens nitratireducens TaxID=1392998 RepID=A0A0N8KQ81_9EURY|nr:universal stress protein [Candidatus Methanoperedens sp. BLZ2]KAB2945041.1 MAG: universal stress protein [Candidatus Methanoperedens sp.]KPQ41402.1 MAG: universal stress protein [Candidatus Methanoperedens sp. BLZ1]MBZ0176621.1 universal stress protein [Candidatus Methanoperedens nitroreducens]VVB52973.1 Universal stress protein family protein [uncultured archaeon]MCX9080345.1 universal stress protein [Candidatus Methanoperedens sp.]
MTKYEILLATDGSEYGRKAEIAAMKITKSYNIKMAAIYVAVAKKDSEREELVSHGEEVLGRVVDMGADMGIDVHKILVGVSMQRIPKMGARAEIIAHAILEAAEKYNVHTIVMGGEGETEINPELGSVAQAVVKKAKCTVLVAR